VNQVSWYRIYSLLAVLAGQLLLAGGVLYLSLEGLLAGVPDATLAATAAAGMLGGVYHAMSSFGAKLGSRTFQDSWAAWYLLHPVESAVLALAVGLILLAGMGADADNAWGYPAAGVLAGLFTKEASRWLGRVARSIFAPEAPDEPQARSAEECPCRVLALQATQAPGREEDGIRPDPSGASGSPS